MAPDPNEESPAPIEAERDEFIKSLSDFAQQRGIPLELAPRVAGKTIHLYDLYTYIIDKGGYDAVSGQKLAWRKVGLDFHLNPANSAAYAFALKTIYYKNLAAYEIRFVHNKEPPPVDILEDLTAKGGDLLNRTKENFQIPARFHVTENGAADSESEDFKSPHHDDKMNVDESALTGRATRGLRQAPPQRVLFQPDPNPQGRRRMHEEQSPAPSFSTASQSAYNYSSANPASANFSIANYEPRPQIPLTLRPIMTPSTNYPLFQAQARKTAEAKKAALGLSLAPTTMKPGSGFEGPNIYVRLLNCIRCPIEAEQDYALHHMVKISHERGDKYKFDSFPGLAEGIIEHLLKVGSLFYDIQWRVSYFQDDNDDPEVLDGINGTPHILHRISNLQRIDSPDGLESAEFKHRTTKILEAGLTLRNLAMLFDNAKYLASMAQVKDLLCITLNLPSTPFMVELKHYMLDVAEQVCQFWRLSQADPLYQSLLRIVLEEDDRGAIVSALRALCRIALVLEENNYLPGFPVAALQRIMDWIVLEDEEFVGVCLDFMYQYTAIPQNVHLLLANSNTLPLVGFTQQLARLLLFRATTHVHRALISRSVPVEPATEIPAVPQELLEQFLRHEEPERSRQWLRAVFEEDAESHITQIALWQAYQKRFLEFAARGPLLQAADFIKNVSNVFQGANAQVITAPTQKFIIKGIRPRHAPMDSKGRVYSPCRWVYPGGRPCDQFHVKPRNMFDHLVHHHLFLSRQEDGRWQFDAKYGKSPRDCYWGKCRHFAQSGSPAASAHELAIHVKTHLPDISTKSAFRQKHNRTATTQVIPVRMVNGDIRPERYPDVDPQRGREATYKQHTTQSTAVDEYGAPLGLPMTSILVLRNLARNVPKAVALSEGIDHEEATFKAMDRLFGPIREQLLHVLGVNRPLAHLVTDLLMKVERAMNRGEEEEKEE